MNEEILFESERTRVARVRLENGGGTAIAKTYIGPDAVERAQREQAFLRRLMDVPGVPSLVPGSNRQEMILLEDTGGDSLAGVLGQGSLGINEALRLAVGIAGVISEIHQRRIVHRDINPTNMLIHGQQRQPLLLDFDLAGIFVEGHVPYANDHGAVGTLAYAAPEQTGRTGWPVDQRADLYGFGATLYEMVTGAPPFGNGDPLALTRDHLIRVPVAPHIVNPAVPVGLSAVIMRLLEKEPDRRYQSAEGVLYDLRKIIENPVTGLADPQHLGERDFPLRLEPPVRPVGRDTELQILDSLLSEVIAGGHRAAVISGQPGVGKTALVNELRPRVAATGGWFLPGKFDQYRADSNSDALQQVLRALATMLLVEPEDSLSALRATLRGVLGSQAGALVAVVPSLQQVIGVPPLAETGDPTTVQERLHRMVLGLLGAVASPNRPVVVFFDDIQWANSTSLALITAILAEKHLRSVLLVCTYRDSEISDTCPLGDTLDQWRMLPDRPTFLALDNLSPVGLRVLLASILRVSPAVVAGLAEYIDANTGGNPFDTVEMVNSLRHDEVLILGDNGWTWHPEALYQHDNSGDVIERLTARIAGLPHSCRELLEAMACLGGAVDTDLLVTASGLPAANEGSPVSRMDVIRLLEPALADGLLALELERDSTAVVRFQHDRIQQAVYNSISPPDLDARHLSLARRLAAVPDLVVASAGQYLPVVAYLTDPVERRQVVNVLWAAARRVRILANYALTDCYLTAARRLLDDAEEEEEVRRLGVELDLERHAARYVLGQAEEVDLLFASIRECCDDSLVVAEAAGIQISSLTNRGRPREALALGLAMLTELGHPPPEPADLAAAVNRGLDGMRSWITTSDETADVQRPVPDDPLSRAIGRILYHVKAPAFFCESELYAWLVVEAYRLWRANGPERALFGILAAAPVITIAQREDYDTGFAINQRVLHIGEQRGYEPETSASRYHYADNAAPWFLPLEESIRQARMTRDGLLREGDVQVAAYTYYASTSQLLDCASTLDEILAEVNSGFALAERTGNSYLAATLVAYRQTIRTLRGETRTLGAPNDPYFDETTYIASLSDNPAAAAYYHINRGMVAAIFGDESGLHRAVVAMRPLLPLIVSNYVRTTSYLVRALDLARRVTLVGPTVPECVALLRELDECRDWLAHRADARPGSFLHLRWLVDAERALAIGDDNGAYQAYDQARWEVDGQSRLWHQALITERLARFQLARGTKHAGNSALREAWRLYRSWGAVGKVAHLEQEYPFLQETDRSSGSVVAPRATSVSSDAVDLLAVLRASQALSSETDLVRLRVRVVEVLRSLTGASAVHILGWRPDVHDWHLLGSNGGELSLSDAANQRLVPLSVFRYVDRTHEPLLVDDLVQDDRFRGDPYVSGLDSCSLLVMPILTRNDAKAMLILEKRHSRAAFGTHRLDSVRLIAGQLAVSLDNALLYASLERQVAARTSKLKELNDQLELLAITDPLTGLANRRHLMDVLASEWHSSIGTHASIGLAMIDVDHFKLYNDHYGHPAGDRCLRAVAKAISQSVRDADLLARYGGEEFAIILPGATVPITRLVAERVRNAVASLREPHALSERGIVTISVGIAAASPGSGNSAEQLVKIADTELYRAKDGGRDRVSGGPPDADSTALTADS